MVGEPIGHASTSPRGSLPVPTRSKPPPLLMEPEPPPVEVEDGGVSFGAVSIV